VQAKGVHASAEVEVDLARGKSCANPRRVMGMVLGLGRGWDGLAQNAQSARTRVDDNSHAQNLSDSCVDVDGESRCDGATPKSGWRTDMMAWTMRRTIIVGDVHGCAEELQLLLRKCGYRKGDRVVLAGDLVAKGPDSQAVVQLAREDGVLAVLGNHDAFALAHRKDAENDRVWGRRAYLRDLRDEDWAFLESLPLFLRLGAVKPEGPEVVVLHAGAVPGLAIEKQTREHLLSLRSITDLGEPTSRLLLNFGWATRWQGPERIVFGHDAVRGLQQHPWATGLDTGCVYGRQLTALILPDEELIHVAALRRYAGH
jgi:predicted phosphodiesterase